VLLAPSNKLGLGALDRELDLVGDGLDASLLENLATAVNVQVRDTNRLDEALVDELLHLAPGGDDVVREGDVEEALALGRELDVLSEGEDTLRGVDLPVDLDESVRSSLGSGLVLLLTFQWRR
jgi:hypothetical protein